MSNYYSTSTGGNFFSTAGHPPVTGSMFDNLYNHYTNSATFNTYAPVKSFESSSNKVVVGLIEEENKIRGELLSTLKKLDEAKEGELEKLKDKYSKLQKELKDVLDTVNISKKIHNSALAKIASDNNFHKLLGGGQSHQDTFVVSVDIRRSTELMLKAKNSEQFANFITQLCNSLVEIFKNNFAIVDKFTGDGILAFFPAFFTESDAGYYACRAASEAIDKFRELYANNRDSFKSILTDVGLGVGIDFGEVYFADLVGSLTVIGEPVVYACRFGSAPAGKIFVNQPAYAKLRAERYLDCFRFEETEVEIKHQGKHLCYSLVVDSRCSSFNAASPSWYSASIVDPIKISS